MLSEQVSKYWAQYLQEKMMLIDYNEYLKLVAKAYETAPLKDPRAIPHFQAMLHDVERFFRMISSKVSVEFVDYDPYSTAEEVHADVVRNKRLRVMTLHSEHPFFTPEQNWKFRAVHDWFSHILGKTDFSPKGEIRAYNVHAKMFSPAALPALFTEIVGQVAAFLDKGTFQVQKVAILPGFNYTRLGEVEGYVIQQKQLVPHSYYGVTEAKAYAVSFSSEGVSTTVRVPALTGFKKLIVDYVTAIRNGFTARADLLRTSLYKPLSGMSPAEANLYTTKVAPQLETFLTHYFRLAEKNKLSSDRIYGILRMLDNGRYLQQIASASGGSVL